MANRDLGEPKRTDAAAIAVRICFCVVFLLNIQCALGFALFPGEYVASYQLEGPAGLAAIRGIGVAFLMWNATYPAFIVAPRRFKVLGWVVIAQQLIGLVGESLILASVASVSGMELLCSSILRFIVFDGAGLVIMGISFAVLLKSRLPKPVSGKIRL